MTQRIWAYQPKTNSVELKNSEKPTLASNEILIKNKAIGINPVDWKFIHANPLNWQQDHVPGVDGAGEIVEVGEGVDINLIGKRVAYHAALAQNGSFAELTVTKAERVMLIPEALSFEQAACLPCPMLTAWQAFEKIPFAQNRNVLVVGFGAVNSLLAQMLISAGFNVDVISKSLNKEEANKLAIHHIYRSQNEIEKKYFAIFDAVSGENAAKLVPLLKANGHIVCIQDRIPAPVDAPFTRTISYHELALGALHHFGDSQDWQELMQNGENLMSKMISGKMTIPDPVVFSFEQMSEALQHSKETKLKTVVSVN